MPITLGILAQSRQAVAASDFVLLEQRVLTGTESSVVFSNVNTLGAGYKHLQIRASFASTSASNSPAIFFNGITGSSYSWHFLNGDGSTVSSGAAPNQANMFIGQGGTNANTDNFGAHVIDILDAFNTNKNKTIRTLSGLLVPGYLNSVYLNSGVFLNTAAITSITFTDRLGASYAAKSRFSLYGVK